ncbi:hypothetical protein ScPMuIL_009955 [Solemya velum]
MIIVIFAVVVSLFKTGCGTAVAGVFRGSSGQRVDRRIQILQEQYDSLVMDNAVLQMRYQQLEERLTYQEKHGIAYIVVSGGYTDWSQCEVTCGGGTQTRYKLCGEDGKNCTQTQESRSCNTQECPISAGGAMYVRYGRTTCPENGTDMVYTGYVSGSRYTHSGGGVNYLCLPVDPVFGPVNSELPIIHATYIYGAEYEVFGEGVSQTLFGDELAQHDVPCAVCRSRERSSVFVFPAMYECHDGWHSEYNGYLVSGYYTHQSQKTIECMDSHSEKIDGGSANLNGALFYPVVTKSGVLPSPPYLDDHVVPCSVCTK